MISFLGCLWLKKIVDSMNRSKPFHDPEIFFLFKPLAIREILVFPPTPLFEMKNGLENRFPQCFHATFFYYINSDHESRHALQLPFVIIESEINVECLDG